MSGEEYEARVIIWYLWPLRHVHPGVRVMLHVLVARARLDREAA